MVIDRRGKVRKTHTAPDVEPHSTASIPSGRFPLVDSVPKVPYDRH